MTGAGNTKWGQMDNSLPLWSSKTGDSQIITKATGAFQIIVRATEAHKENLPVKECQWKEWQVQRACDRKEQENTRGTARRATWLVESEGTGERRGWVSGWGQPDSTLKTIETFLSQRKPSKEVKQGSDMIRFTGGWKDPTGFRVMVDMERRISLAMCCWWSHFSSLHLDFSIFKMGSQFSYLMKKWGNVEYSGYPHEDSRDDSYYYSGLLCTFPKTLVHLCFFKWLLVHTSHFICKALCFLKAHSLQNSLYLKSGCPSGWLTFRKCK